MVVSQKQGDPNIDPKILYYSPFYWDLKMVPLILENPRIMGYCQGFSYARSFFVGGGGARLGFGIQGVGDGFPSDSAAGFKAPVRE